MTDKKVDDTKRIDEEPNSLPAVPAGSRMSPFLKGLLLILVPIIAAAAAYRAGLLDPAIGWVKSYQAGGQPVTALTGLPVTDLISSSDLLTAVGKSPVDPSSVLFPSFDESRGTNSPDAAKACPPELFEAESQEGEVSNRTTIKAGSVGLSKKESEPPEKDGADKPAIMTRKPSEKDSGGKEGDRSISPSSAVHEAHAADPAMESDESFDLSGAKNVQGTAKGKERHTANPVKPPPPIPRKTSDRTKGVHQPNSHRGEAVVSTKPDSAPSDAATAERFRLPGALKVKIAGYAGSLSKWGIMVILDDSASMAKKAKPWAPNRNRAAVTLVGKLPEIMTPGSKIAVRDFLCRKSTDKGRGRPCLSHMLYGWAGSPFKELKPSLDRVDPQGWNNPCAAAAFVVKRDLRGLGKLAARVLLVTNGDAKCKGREVVRAIDRFKGNGKIALDVIALRMFRKSRRSYVRLVKKTGGAFLKVAGPDDLDMTLERYKKVLHKRTLEQVEVRGENSVYTVNPGEEITLAPGSYSVVLPLVANLKPSKRTIGNVTIKSGETKILKVKIRKGRPQVRFARR